MKVASIVTLLLLPLLFSNCTKVLYSHEEVMDKLLNKDYVLRKFGVPPIKRQEGDVEEWVYNYGSTSISKSAAVAKAGYDYYNNVNAFGIGTGRVDTYQRYAKFTFNKNGYVMDWVTQGVNFEERTRAKGKTIAAIAGSAIVTAGVIVGAIIASNEE